MYKISVYILTLLSILSSCKKKEVKCIYEDNVPSLTIVAAEDEVRICHFNGMSFQIEAPVQTGAKYFWELTDDTTSSITVIDPAEYKVRIVNGLDTTMYTTYIDVCGSFFLPKTFHPGGWSGVNKTFGPIGLGIGCIYMEIRNSQGQKVYETNDLNEPWNGGLNNSKPILAVGIYTYYIDLMFSNGSPHTSTGTVTLLQ